MSTTDSFERCVLVEGKVIDITDEKFRSYFENGVKSGGGDIKELKRSSKGLCVEFVKKEGALGVINKRKHRIGGIEFLASQLQPPLFYKDIICVTDLPDDYDNDNLVNFVEGRAQVALNKIQYNDDKDTAVISFSKDIDFISTKDRIAEKKFSGKYIQIKPVEVSKAIKVSGLKKGITDEIIKLYFENKRKNGGGKVSKIDRIEEIILVHFEDSDAPLRVIKKQHKMEDEEIKVEVYHNCLSIQSELDNPKESYIPDPIVITEEIMDLEKIQMLHEHPGLLQSLNTNLDIIPAKISIADTGNMTIACTATECTKEKRKQLESWRNNVMKSIHKFFENNVHREAIPIQKDLIVNAKEWLETNCKDQQYMYRFEKDGKLVIEGAKDTVKILSDGVRQNINEQREIIDNQNKVKNEIIELEEEQMLYLKLSGLLTEITEKCPGNTLNILGNSIHICGTENEIKQGKEEIKKSIPALKKHQPHNLSQGQIEIIAEPCNTEKLCQELSTKGLRCALIFKKKLNILLKTTEDHSTIEIALNELVPIQDVKIPPEKQKFLPSEAIKNGVEKIMSLFSTEASFSVDASLSIITVTAMANIMNGVTEKLNGYFNNLCLTTKSLEFKSENRKKYFYEKGEELITEMEKKFRVDCQWQDDGEELFASALEAEEENLTNVQKYIDEISENHIEKTLYFKGPGVANLLKPEVLERNAQTAVVEVKGLDPEEVDNFDVDKTFRINGTDVEVKIGHGTPALLHSDVVLVPINKNRKSLTSLKLSFDRELLKSFKEKIEGEILIAKDTSNFYSSRLVYGIYPQVESDSEATMISNIIRESLEIAEKEKFSSIAIPIVKTNHQVLNKEIRKTSYNVVQDYFTETKPASYIQTVWYYGDKKDSDFISNAEKSNEENRMKVKRKYRKKGNSKNTAVTGRVRMLLVTSDIVHEETHVLVNSSNEQLDLRQGAIANSLLKKCGEELQKECAKKYPNGIKQGEVAFTDSFNIVNTKRIYHVCLPPYEKDKELQTLVSSVKKCLVQATFEKLQNISFPPLGCGILRYPRTEVAKKLFETVYEFGKDNPDTSLSDVTFVMYHKDEHVIKAFGAQEEQYKEQYSILNKNTNFLEETDDCTEENLPLGIYRKSTAILINVYAPNYENVKKFEKFCLDTISNGIRERVERSSELQEYDDDELSGLMNQIRQKGLQVEVVVDRNEGRFEIRGCANQLSDICQLFKQYCASMKEMTKNATNLQNVIQWYYTEITETGEVLTAYDFMQNFKIETAYTSNEASVSIKDDEGKEFIIDLVKLTEHAIINDKKDQTVVIVVRKNQIADLTVEPPEEWGGINLNIESLEPQSNEYKQVKRKFEELLGVGYKASIVRIDLIKNATLYRQYHAMKKKIEEENGGSAQEKQLFHGTNLETTKKINKEGFNRSYSNQDNCALGIGVYFATESAYSARDDYAKSDKDNCKYMYLADVLVGECVKGEEYEDKNTKKRRRKLPLRDVQKNIYFNSAVDNVKNPRTYVIFNDNQAYPKYLICFKNA